MSLKWRIASAYSLLLVVVLCTMGGLIVARFQTILFDQAQARVNMIMGEIVQAALPANPFAIPDFANESLVQLFNSKNLAAWESPTTFIQVDSVDGYPLARTANLGGTDIPANPSLGIGHDVAVRTITLANRPFLIEDRLLRSGSAAAVVHVAEPLDALNRTFEQTRQAIIFILIAAAIAVGALSFALAAQAIGPIATLSSAMRQIGSDHLNLRLPANGRTDEIGELTSSFNDLLARLHDAFARERQFISDASHELKTPLTSINANAQLLLRWGDRDETVRRESLETIQRESAVLAEMVNGMLTLAKADRGDAIPREPLSLRYIAQEAVRNASQRAAAKGLTLDVDGPAALIVEGDEHLVRQLIANLIDNAIKFTPSGAVMVRLGGDAAHAWVDIADTGPGIPESELPYIFDRFFRADKARSRDVPGTGLGLAIVRSIARVHGASVDARNRAQGGAVFRVTFPRLDENLTEPS